MTTNLEPDIKQRIMNAARELISQQGFDGTTVRQICEHAGANVALVSYYFGGKDGLFQAMMSQMSPTERLKELNDLTADPDQSVRFIIREVILFRQQNKEYVNIIQREIFSQSPRMEFVQNINLPLWQKLRTILQIGREHGIFQFESLDNTLMCMIGTLLFHKNSVYFGPVLTEGKQEIETTIRNTTQFLLNALGYKGDTSTYKANES
ncbi:TetR family transcriptional regulator [Paenibacillus sp. KN14-4R]|uniref:TetR family transcriptional regulator n=1 Tax=Paenibacillus sp. KN14-4R TaxID=3445773 RepID=UPI003F9FAB19